MTNPTPTVQHLERAGRIWQGLQQHECAGLLYIALRYEQGPTSTADYVNSMSLRQWDELGHPLQIDLARAFDALRAALAR